MWIDPYLWLHTHNQVLCIYTFSHSFSFIYPVSPNLQLFFSTPFVCPSCPPLFPSSCGRISTEHSPKLQIRSHSYLRAVSEVSINRSLDSLDPAGLLASPKFRSRNESYMRAMSTISQVSGTQRPVTFCRWPLRPLYIHACRGEEIPS